MQLMWEHSNTELLLGAINIAQWPRRQFFLKLTAVIVDAALIIFNKFGISAPVQPKEMG